MNSNWGLFLIIAAFVVFAVLNSKYRKGKAFQQNMFWVDDVLSTGVAGSIEVFALYDKDLGKLVGMLLNNTGEDQRICLTPGDALYLAELLEESAQAAVAMPAA